MEWDKYREDFLWFSYFGVTKEDVNNKLAKAILVCSRRAFADLSRTLDYKYSVEKLKQEDQEFRKLFEQWKTCFRCIVDGKIVARVSELLSKNDLNQKEFDKWHEKTCEDIICAGASSRPNELKEEIFLFRNKGNDTNKITYGQAQKWVNMTLKNLLIMDKIENKSIVACLHIPLDSYIYDAAAVRKDKKIYEHMDVNGLGISKPKVPWSGMEKYGDEEEENSYMCFQHKVREECGKQAPIEWEGKAWIAQAKCEKRKERCKSK